MKRIPTQIAVGTIGSSGMKVLIVLANDGTLWQRMTRKTTNDGVTSYKSEWKEIPALPDDNSNFSKVR